MPKINEKIYILEVTTENIADVGIFCIKDKKSPGYHAKVECFKSKLNQELKVIIATDSNGKQV